VELMKKLILLVGISLFISENIAYPQDQAKATQLLADAEKMENAAEPDWLAIINKYKEALALTPRSPDTGEKEYVQKLVEWAQQYADSPHLWCNEFDLCVEVGQRSERAGKDRLAFGYYTTAWSESYRPFQKPFPPNHIFGPALAGPVASARRPYSFVDDFYTNLNVTPKQRDLFARIIDVSARLKPAPERSEGARRLLLSVINKFDAIREMEEGRKKLEEGRKLFPVLFDAINGSPWWPDVYLATGSVAKALNACGIAREAFSLFLRLAPSDSPYLSQAKADLLECRK
jgi:hypothetical protein